MEPARVIAENAGFAGEVVVEELKKREYPVGFDAVKGEYVDMFEAGIIDPHKGHSFGFAECSIHCMPWY